MATVVSYERMKGIEAHCEQLRTLLHQQLLIREELRVMLGLDRDSWNKLIEHACKEIEYDHSILDPFKTFKDICTLMGRIASDTTDDAARVIATETIKLCREDVLNYITREEM